MRAQVQKRGEATRDRILDAAEQLLARRGLDGVSVREITALAQVDVALAHYHFGSKDGLFDAVLGRRAAAMNARRITMLDEAIAKAAPHPPCEEAVISAFVWPVAEIMLEGGAGGRAYGALIAQVNNSPHWGRIKMTHFFDDVVRRFIAVLRERFPDCDERELYWAYHFLSGALTLSMAETGRLDNLSDGKCSSEDLRTVFEKMVPYCAAGFRALCSSPPKKID